MMKSDVLMTWQEFEHYVSLKTEVVRLRAALNLTLLLLEDGMTWMEFIVFCEAQGWDSNALTDPYMGGDVESPKFTVIVARELRRRLALAEGAGDDHA